MGEEVIDKYAQRFWSRVERRGPDECWPWRAARTGRGYGAFVHPRLKTRLAHRVAVFFDGRPAADGEVVMHRCDNPPCVNPAHLEVGTQAANIKDAANKGRTFVPTPTVLKPGDLARIRAMRANGITQKKIALEFGVHQVTVSRWLASA